VTKLQELIIEGNVKFQLEVSENKDVIFFPSKFTDPLKSIHGPHGGPCGPKVKNSCPRRTKKNIHHEIRAISREELQGVDTSMFLRYTKCILSGQQHFQHLLQQW
jgi:hypothetical protein